MVTGAAGNMGQAVVDQFLKNDYQVIGTLAPTEADKAKKDNPSFEPVVVDLMDADAAENMTKEVISRHKKIDAAVLTVGGFAMGRVAETSTADIMKQYRLNFETAYNVARPVFNKMVEQGYGRIFMIGSKPGLDARNGKGMVAYGLAKSLIFRLAELMNDEAHGTDVVVSVVVPSTIDTPQNRKAMPEAKFDRWVKPGSIAEAIYFYCTESASVIREPVIKVYNKA